MLDLRGNQSLALDGELKSYIKRSKDEKLNRIIMTLAL